MKQPELLTPQEIDQALAHLSGWTLQENRIQKTFKSKHFINGISKIVDVARTADEVDHHPDIFVHYREVTFTCWTHVSGGVTAKDIDLARRIEEVWS
jgi:4a-hydroxytetrahydrobiopterin dehydratase